MYLSMFYVTEPWLATISVPVDPKIAEANGLCCLSGYL